MITRHIMQAEEVRNKSRHQGSEQLMMSITLGLQQQATKERLKDEERHLVIDV